MDGEVNNQTARIAQDVKRDETDAGDRQTRRDGQTRQTDETDRRDGTLKGVRRLKEGKG